jgi:hypothetical protein
MTKATDRKIENPYNKSIETSEQQTTTYPTPLFKTSFRIAQYTTVTHSPSRLYWDYPAKTEIPTKYIAATP